MSQGYVMLAQNSEHDYVRQAALCAMSLHATNEEPKITLVTDDPVLKEYQPYFDNIVSIPWNDDAKDSDWKIENRWKLYHVSPYEETVVMDTDMIVLQDLTAWWKFLGHYDMYFVSNPRTYRGNSVTDAYYRKGFVANNLANLYTGFHYFKKCDKAHQFYEWMQMITHNWQAFYGRFHKEHFPKRPSMDVTAAIAAKLMDIEDKIVNAKAKNPTFTHMKAYCQGWQFPRDSWRKVVDVHLTPDLDLFIGNFRQTGIFHYTEKEFLTDEIYQTYKEYLT